MKSQAIIGLNRQSSWVTSPFIASKLAKKNGQGLPICEIPLILWSKVRQSH